MLLRLVQLSINGFSVSNFLVHLENLIECLFFLNISESSRFKMNQETTISTIASRKPNRCCSIQYCENFMGTRDPSVSFFRLDLVPYTYTFPNIIILKNMRQSTFTNSSDHRKTQTFANYGNKVFRHLKLCHQTLIISSYVIYISKVKI